MKVSPRRRHFLKINVPPKGAVPDVVRRVFEICAEQHVSAESVADAAGMGATTIHHWRSLIDGPYVGRLEEALAVLGYELRVARIGAPGVQQAGVLMDPRTREKLVKSGVKIEGLAQDKIRSITSPGRRPTGMYRLNDYPRPVDIETLRRRAKNKLEGAIK